MNKLADEQLKLLEIREDDIEKVLYSKYYVHHAPWTLSGLNLSVRLPL